jgi:hypothetical protein
MGWLDTNYFKLYLAMAFLVGIVFSISGVLLEEFSFRRYTSWRELFLLLFFALAKHVGYHQLMLWWRLEGIMDYFRRPREWGEQVRTGFGKRV